MQKLLSAAGVCSRREAEDWILAGRVRVNGTTAVVGDSANPDEDIVEVDLSDGSTIAITGPDANPPGEGVPHYIALNKPAGYACTRRDPHLKRTIYDLLPDNFRILYSIGRLDVDTEGLLLMTRDGELANRIMHPSRHVPKTYRAEVSGRVTPEKIDALRDGVLLSDGPTLTARARLISRHERSGTSIIELTITEGRKRQVRRMLEAVGLRCERLKRTAIGNLSIPELPLGDWTVLTPGEVAMLTGEAEP
ncbi:MAG: rRNA pseudouridine synthase [Armatimonadetes bacterium]|nr:rRNA pseudouridine synthase [Armatimonadota bacterium]